MLNRVNLQGRFVADPELRKTSTGISVVSFTLACERDHNRDEADFISCIAWRNIAEFISKYFQKGKLAVVSGRLQSRSWKDKEGKTRTSWDVITESIYFCDSAKSDGYAGGEPKFTPPKAPDVIADDDPDEIPF